MEKFYLKNKDFKNAYVAECDFISNYIAVLETKEQRKALCFENEDIAKRTVEFINEHSFLQYEVTKEVVNCENK